MASLDASLNVIGTSLQLTSVVFGGLAHPLAKPFREWLKAHAFLSSLLLVTGTIGLARIGASRVIPDNPLTGIVWAVVFGLAFGLSIGVVQWLANWLSEASHASLENVFRAMAVLFGIGLIFHLVAAVTT